MTNPELSKTALAQMLRVLADRVDSGADLYEVGMETERVGHATKTTITLWGLPKPTPEEAELHRRRVQPWRDDNLPEVSRVCGVCPIDQPHTCGLSVRQGTPKSWCSAWRADRPSRCNTFLSTSGTCPNAEKHL